MDNAKIVVACADSELSEAIQESFTAAHSLFQLIPATTAGDTRMAVFEHQPAIVIADMTQDEGTAVDLFGQDELRRDFSMLVLADLEQRDMVRAALGRKITAYSIKSEEGLRELPYVIEQISSNTGMLRQAVKKGAEEVTRYEDELLEAHARLQERDELVQNGPAVMFSCRNEPGWPIEFISRNVENWGHTAEELLSAGDGLAKLIHEEDAELAQAEANFYTKKPYHKHFRQQYRISPLYGDAVHVEAWTWMKRDDNGDVTHLQGMLTDVSEQRKKERKIWENERQYRDLVETVDEWIWQMTPEGEITYCSPRAKQLLGLRVEQIEGRSFFDFVEGGAESEFAKQLEWSREYRLPITDVDMALLGYEGRRIAAETSAVPYCNNNEIAGYRCSTRDLSERVQLNAQLQESYDYINTVYGSINSAIMIVDADTHEITDVNDRMLELTGYSREELLGETCSGKICQVRDGVCPYRRTEVIIQRHENEIMNRDGEWLPVHKTVVPIRINGRDCLVHEFVDVRELRSVERSNREQESFLRTLFDYLPVAVYAKEVGQDGRMTYAVWNRYAEKLFGKDSDEVIGKTNEELFSEDVAESFGRKDQIVLDELESIEDEEEPILSDALGPRILHTIRTPIFDDNQGLSHILCILEDVTDRKCVEDQVVSLSRFPDENPNPILRISAVGEILYRNGAAEKLLAAAGAENELLASWQRRLSQAMETGKVVNAEEKIGTRTYSLMFNPILNAGYVNVYGADITFRKIAEEKLCAKNQHLEELNRQFEAREKQLVKSKEDMREKNAVLRELNLKLRDHQRQLVQSEKMAGLGQLAAGVAHEINNPVGYVKSNIGTLHEYVDVFTKLLRLYDNVAENAKEIERIREDEDVAYLLDDVETLLTESEEGLVRVQEIVKNLKSFARVDEAAKKRANINDCIEATLKVVWNELKYNCTVEKDYGDIPPIVCFPGQLNQVFMNLLVNASHAIEEQGKISIGTAVESGNIQVKIRDTGKGIPKENLPKLFEPFFTTKEVGKGTGLGLSISHGIIEKHGGSIEVESAVGEGTCFTIELPVTAGNGEDETGT